MTVKEAVAELHRHCGIPNRPGFATDLLSGDDFSFMFIETRHWLFALAGQAMEKQFGPYYGLNKNLPPDIDAAAVLTADQEREFRSMLKRLSEVPR